MSNKRYKASINSTTFSQAEIKMYEEHLKLKTGAKQQAINLSGLSHTSFIRALSGQVIRKDTKQKIVKAIMKVIQTMQAL